jgi:hypothetical protein
MLLLRTWKGLNWNRRYAAALLWGNSLEIVRNFRSDEHHHG